MSGFTGYEWVLEVETGQRKYNPGQPRVPAGQSGGGRWTSGSGGGTSGTGNGSPRAVAQGILAEARKIEPAVTRAVTGAVSAHGGQMYGLEYRVKGEGSLTRKIKSVVQETGMSPEEVGRTQIRDAVRYTALFDNDNYLKGATAVQQSLKDQGWEQYDHQFKNYWKPGDAYDGYNCVFVNDKGFKIELQFHTPQSIQTKEKSHALYEKARVLPPGPEYSKLTQQMVDLWGQVPKPRNWQQLPGRTM